MLVVVEYRDIELALERLLYLKAPGRGDVLEVYAAEAGRERPDRRDDLARLMDVEADGHGVEPAELLEEQGLALHYRHGGERTDVPEPQHGGAVGYDGDEAAPGRELPDGLGPANYLAAGLGDAGRVGRREPVPVRDADLGRDCDLAPVLPVHTHCRLVVVHPYQLLCSVPARAGYARIVLPSRVRVKRARPSSDLDKNYFSF